MKVIYAGHRYELDTHDGEGPTILQFVQRPPHHRPHSGTLNQEVCRALIDRLEVLDSERPWADNEVMINMLRMIIILHEIRAYYYHNHHRFTPAGARVEVFAFVDRAHKLEGMKPEDIPTGKNGHWDIP